MTSKYGVYDAQKTSGQVFILRIWSVYDLDKPSTSEIPVPRISLMFKRSLVTLDVDVWASALDCMAC